MTSFPSYDGTVLSYDSSGTGSMLVCLAGGPGSSAAYFEDLAGLTSHRTVLLFDPRGVGRSELPAEGDFQNPFSFVNLPAMQLKDATVLIVDDDPTEALVRRAVLIGARRGRSEPAFVDAAAVCAVGICVLRCQLDAAAGHQE